jgi:hypothetical protein
MALCIPNKQTNKQTKLLTTTAVRTSYPMKYDQTMLYVEGMKAATDGNMFPLPITPRHDLIVTADNRFRINTILST